MNIFLPQKPIETMVYIKLTFLIYIQISISNIEQVWKLERRFEN